MPAGKPTLLMIVVQSDEQRLLESLRKLDSEDLRLGDLQEKPPIRDAAFDPVAIPELLYQVLGVVGTVGGAVTFIDWILQKGDKATVLVQIGETVVNIGEHKDPEALRKKLTELLTVESE